MKLFFIRVSLFFLILVSVELGAYLFNRDKYVEFDHCTNCWPGTLHDKLKYWHPKDKTFKATKTCQKRASCFDVQYSFDQWGRRIHSSNELSGDQQVIFLGDSFTFGFGVGENETLPFYFEKHTGIKSYNFGFNGAGPHLLDRLSSSELLNSSVKGKADLFIVLPYVSIFRPLAGTHNTYNDKWRLTYGGLDWLANLLGSLKDHSHFLKAIEFEYSPYSHEEQVEETIATLISIISKYRKGRVFIVEHPFQPFEEVHAKMFKDRFVDLIRFKIPEEIKESGAVCPCDIHPNARVNDWVAQQLKKIYLDRPKDKPSS